MDLNTQLQNAAVRFGILAEEQAAAADKALDDAEERIGRMQGPTRQTLDQIDGKAQADAERALALSRGYEELAESARQGRLEVPRAVYESKEFNREFQGLIGQASQQGRFKIVD